jgi:hypothetical protein
VGITRAIAVTKLPDWDLQTKSINAYVVAVVRAERDRTPQAHRVAANAARQGIQYVRRRKKYFTDRVQHHEELAEQLERQLNQHSAVPEGLDRGETDGMWIWLAPREKQERVYAIATCFCRMDLDLGTLQHGDIRADRFENSRAIKVLFANSMFAVQPLAVSV